MLHQEKWKSLTEALRPPPAGWRLDFALGTTYSLDLMTLLTVPLSFSFFDVEDHEGNPIADPIRVIEALRRKVMTETSTALLLIIEQARCNWRNHGT